MHYRILSEFSVLCNRSLLVIYIMYVCPVAKSCLTFCDLMDCSLPRSPVLFMGFSRQEYWSGVPLPSLMKRLSSVTHSCPTLCNSMDCSTPGFPVHHQLPELAQTHVHRVGDAIQPSQPLSSPSLPAFDLSQHQGLFQ